MLRRVVLALATALTPRREPVPLSTLNPVTRLIISVAILVLTFITSDVSKLLILLK